jgi:hypothetical protein
MKRRMATITMSLALGLAACGESTLAPEADAATGPMLQAQPVKGTGLILNSLTGVSLPILGQIGEVDIDQAIITDLMLVEDIAGTIIGLEVSGIINGTLTATGVPIVEEEFTSSVGITSSGPGQCELVTIDLGPLRIDGLSLVTLDVPEANLTGRGSGAVGSLLCNLGQALSGIVGGVTRGVQGLVNAINRVI